MQNQGRHGKFEPGKETFRQNRCIVSFERWSSNLPGNRSTETCHYAFFLTEVNWKIGVNWTTKNGQILFESIPILLWLLQLLQEEKIISLGWGNTVHGVYFPQCLKMIFLLLLESSVRLRERHNVIQYDNNWIRKHWFLDTKSFLREMLLLLNISMNMDLKFRRQILLKYTCLQKYLYWNLL